MDPATLIGVVTGTALITWAIIIGGSPALFLDVPSILIVFGGTTATLFIRYPLSDVFGTWAVIRNAFFYRLQTQTEIIAQFKELSQLSRKEGLLALERVELPDPFLRKGINYCVDGAETRQIETILVKEIQYMKARHRTGQEILRSITTSAPAFGMIGTLIGLVQMLSNMDDPKKIGPAMATAILTTLYGAIVAYLLAQPLADKLAYRSGQEADAKLLMVEGILGLKRGENPRMLEETLHSFVSPTDRAALRAPA